MKLRSMLATCAMAGAIAVPVFAGSAGAAPTDTTLTVVDGYQYSSTSLMSHTVCLDDQLVKTGDEIITTGVETTSGDHVLRVIQGDTTCDDESGDWYTTPVTLLDVPAQTLAFGWGEGQGEGATVPTWIFEDSTECLPAGTTDVVYRNVSTGGMVANFGETTGDVGDAEALIGDVAVGDEGAAQLDAGRYPSDAGSTAIGWGVADTHMETFESGFDSLAGEAGTVTDIYVIGGADGDTGLFEVVRDVGTCEEEPTTTMAPETTMTAPPTTVAPAGQARAATPVAASPSYTG